MCAPSAMRRTSRRSCCRVTGAVATRRARVWRMPSAGGRSGKPRNVQVQASGNHGISATLLDCGDDQPAVRGHDPEAGRPAGTAARRRDRTASARTPGPSRRALAAAAGIHHSLVDRVEDGARSAEQWRPICVSRRHSAADFTAHLYAEYRPRDPGSVSGAEHPRRGSSARSPTAGMPYPEAAVRRPARGCDRPRAARSDGADSSSRPRSIAVRRLEQLVPLVAREGRLIAIVAMAGKACTGRRRSAQLLIVRRTRANVETARAADRQLGQRGRPTPSDALCVVDRLGALARPSAGPGACERGDVRFLDRSRLRVRRSSARLA